MAQGIEHRLVGNSKPECIAHAIFDVRKDNLVAVLALIGASSYIDRLMSRADARAEYKRLIEAGWVKPTAEQIKSMPRNRLKMLIYD